MSRKILVVIPDDTEQVAVLDILTGAGYEARGLSTFEDASRVLASQSVDLLITDERLGTYNGLHLVLKARTADPKLRAIVIADAPNPGLELDAARANAECVVRPTDPREWLKWVSQILESRAKPKSIK